MAFLSLGLCSVSGWWENVAGYSCPIFRVHKHPGEYVPLRFFPKEDFTHLHASRYNAESSNFVKRQTSRKGTRDFWWWRGGVGCTRCSQVTITPFKGPLPRRFVLSNGASNDWQNGVLVVDDMTFHGMSP